MMEHHGPDEHSPIEHAFDPAAFAARTRRREAMAERGTISIGELREALISATDLGGAWGQNMHESKKVLLRVGGETYPLARVSAAFIGGSFVLVLDGPGPDEAG